MVNLALLGEQLDTMVLEVFQNINDSVILPTQVTRIQKFLKTSRLERIIQKVSERNDDLERFSLRKESVLFILSLYCRYNQDMCCDTGSVLNKIQSKSLYFMRESKIVEILLVLLS